MVIRALTEKPHRRPCDLRMIFTDFTDRWRSRGTKPEPFYLLLRLPSLLIIKFRDPKERGRRSKRCARRHSYSTPALTFMYLRDVLLRVVSSIQAGGKSEKNNLGFFTVKQSADVGSAPLWGIQSFVLLPCCLPVPFCSELNMFPVFLIKFHCKTITLPHCSSALNTWNHLRPHLGTLSPVMARISVLHLFSFDCFLHCTATLESFLVHSEPINKY